MATKRADAPSVVRRVLLALAILGALAFAVEGGEWGTLDLWRQRGRLARLKVSVDSLRHEVDSLKAYKKALESDPVLQEKIAREEFGMVRGSKELLYRFSDSARRDTARKKGR
ncbi:MAG: septum formation initiator family protein [Gemmatimonadetes bacterium]|nr:septum formation initiator family protein [Gemmatimonadota bacterium]